jgi:hypothetical protein
MTLKKRVFEPLSQWTTDFCQNNGFYDHLKALFDFEQWTDFPSVEQLNNLLPNNTQTCSGHPVVFKRQDDVDFNGRAYEAVIYETGHVPTRHNSWHDLFGALIWCVMPKTKAVINQLHHQDILSFGLKARTKTRNAITLLDECGVILAISQAEFKTRLRNHDWHWSFVERRPMWGKTVAPFMFGHANYEMLTKAYIGLTGKVLFVSVEADFFSLELSQQYQQLDTQLVEMITDDELLKDNSHLSPLPLLGVPGWHNDNKNPAFYDNKQYFREKREK